MIDVFGKAEKSTALRRRGAAFLLLVMMVLIVIASATQWLLSGSVANRKGELNQLRTRSMLAAMQQAQSIVMDWDTALQFPIDKTRNERIEMVTNREESSMTAIWLRGEIEIARINRPFSPPSDSTQLADP